jgi:hypothetical protein
MTSGKWSLFIRTQRFERPLVVLTGPGLATKNIGFSAAFFFPA